MFKIHSILKICLALALFLASFSGAQAAPIVIDDFATGDQQQAPPDGTVEAPSAIGGERFLEAAGEVLGLVSEGQLLATNSNSPGGLVQAVWSGGGALGGIDLTDGGSNTSFEVFVSVKSPAAVLETLGVEVEDSNSVVGTVSVNWTELSLGSNLIPFSSLSNGVDLTSVDLIRLNSELVQFPRSIAIGSFSAVPEPSSALLLGLGITCLGVVRRSRRRGADL